MSEAELFDIEIKIKTKKGKMSCNFNVVGGWSDAFTEIRDYAQDYIGLLKNKPDWPIKDYGKQKGPK